MTTIHRNGYMVMVARMMIVGVMIQKWNGNIPLILSKMVLFSVTGIYPPEIIIN
jgi:hypothetical protein